VIPSKNMTCLTPLKCGSLEVPELPQSQIQKPKTETLDQALKPKT
jgi:hypothetical protein